MAYTTETSIASHRQRRPRVARPNPIPFNQRELLTIDECSGMIRRGRSGIYEMIKAGELSSVTVGRRRFVPRSEVDRYIAAILSGAKSAA